MTESLGLLIPIMVGKRLVLLGSVIPRQLQQTLTIGRALSLAGDTLGTGISEEVEVEFGLLVDMGAEERHAQDFLVELEGLFGVLDSEHGVVLGDR